MLSTTFQKVVPFLYVGQHRRLCTTASTPLPVMRGALAVYCTRYGVSDTNLSKTAQTHK